MIQQVSLRTGLVYFSVAILICVCGAYAAYVGPLSSDAWQCWAGPRAWMRDGLRALVAAILTFYALAQMRVFSDGDNPSPQTIRVLLPATRVEWWLLVVSLLIALSSTYFLGTSFKGDLSARPSCAAIYVTSEFAQIWLPYLPYMLYVLAFWLGILFPVLLVLVRWIGLDVAWWRTDSAQLRSCFKTVTRSEGHPSMRDLDRILVTFQAYVIRLKEIAERYISVLIAVVIGILYEQLTASWQTVTTLAVDFGKLILWLLVGPLLFLFITFVAAGYQRSVRSIEQLLGAMLEAIEKEDAPSPLRDKVLAARGDLIWNRSSASFVISVTLNATVAMPLLLALSGYALNALVQGKWIEILLPAQVATFFRWLYQ